MPDKNQNADVPQLDSKYRKILIASMRSKQIQKGARPRVNLPNAKPTRIALAEVERGLVQFDLTTRPAK